jgi:hypothetical protein
MSKGCITSSDSVISYITGGHGAFTFLSLRTGRRYTFRATQGKRGVLIIKVLNGADNTSSFIAIGSVQGKRFQNELGTPAAHAFSWAWNALHRGSIPSQLEVYHDGHCGRCGRLLTTPGSVTSGLGPICAKRER